MKTTLYLVLLMMFLSFKNGIAQQSPTIETNRLMDLLKKLEGTYQLQIIDSRELPAIPLSLMDTIQAKRDEKIVKYIWLKNNIRVKILPKSEIYSSTFKGLNRISYISSSDLN